MTIINAWPLLLILLLWLYKERIDRFYQAHLSFFNSTGLNIIALLLYSIAILVTQFKLTWQAVIILVILNVACDTYLILKSRHD